MAKVAFDRNTGNIITGFERVKQAIATIIETKIGDYLGMRHFGSYVPDLIDEPLDGYWLAMVMAAITQAIVRFEPEFMIDEFEFIEINQSGKVVLAINGMYKPIDSEIVDPQNLKVVV